MSASIQQVLLHFDSTRAAVHRLEVARALAQDLGASLATLYAATPGVLEVPFAPEVGPTLAAELSAVDEQRIASARKAFEAAMRGPGTQASWCELDRWPVATEFAQQALYADLLVLGQHDRDHRTAGGVPVDFAESVIVGSGRPALVVPYAPVPWRGAGTVVIAWKETREAARAVSAALPILQRARRVHVLQWGGSDDPRPGSSRLDLHSFLERHGVQASWHREASEPESIGDVLLSRAFDLEADMLVMGCYGHSRAREWVLGGASRTLLQSMTLPVLMAH